MVLFAQLKTYLILLPCTVSTVRCVSIVSDNSKWPQHSLLGYTWCCSKSSVSNGREPVASILEWYISLIKVLSLNKIIKLFLIPCSDIQTDDDQDHRLSKEKLIALTSCQPLLDYLVACDHILYQCIINFLISNVLRPIPATLTQAIRNFAKNLENWMNSCLEGYPVKCMQAKVSIICVASAITITH